MSENLKKVNALMGLAAPDRYDHFIKFVADRRSLWGLWSDGWGLHETNDDSTVVFPVWPARIFAELSANEDWSHFEPREIELDDVLDVLIPRLRGEGYKITVFPVPGIGGIVPELDLLEDDLRSELRRIE